MLHRLHNGLRFNPQNTRRFTMGSLGRFRRLLFMLGTVVVFVAALVGTKLATTPVKAQVVAPIDVFVFHCALIPNLPLEVSNLGSFNLTFTRSNNAFINASDCSEVIADALKAGYRLKSALALPNGGPGGTGATEYMFVRGGNQ
jgi:hypothetical protein